MRNTFTRSSSARSPRRTGSRGQVVVIFAAAIVVLIALCGVVIDVAWYWTGNLRMQRAADAAALAGVVWLPGNPSQAQTVARAEASKNGYTHGTGGVVVTPSVDPNNNRRLNVSINGTVGTFFSGVVGVNSWPAQRTAKADYVLPVPMGSPINYYGVGFYQGRVETTYPPVTADSGWRVPGNAPSGGEWSPSSGSIAGSVTVNDNTYATESSNGQRQQWSTFGLQSGGSAIPTPASGQTLTIVGLEARLSDAFVSATCNNSTIGVDLSWNQGSSWSTRVNTSNLTTDTSTDPPTLGASNTTAAWGSHTWVRGDFSDTNFRIRLQANKGCSTSSTTLRVDMLEMRVTWRLDTASTWAIEELTVPDPASGSALTSQGFWGAIFTSGGWRQNGDKYAPAIIGGNTALPSTAASPTYNANGYDYTIELPGGSGQVRLFDPMYCATGQNTSGGWYGAGDHWTNQSTAQPPWRPVAVTYRLYNTQGTLQDTSDDGPPVQTLTYDPGSASKGDFSGRFGTPQNNTDANRSDCANDAGHNQWVQLASGLAAGNYRLNVNTSLQAANMNVGAENLFSIWAQSGGQARVYGGGRMAAYTNLDGGTQEFYFAQIERVHAGKTMVIQLFDPGEMSGNAYLRIRSPDGNIYHDQLFSWASDDGRHQENVYQIQTAVNGAAQFDNREITITIPLPATYGQGGLNPPGDATDEDGWWRIEYDVNAGNDTTTWSVDIRGNPVHLVTP